jgi:hypothetical protein
MASAAEKEKEILNFPKFFAKAKYFSGKKCMW